MEVDPASLTRVYFRNIVSFVNDRTAGGVAVSGDCNIARCLEVDNDMPHEGRVYRGCYLNVHYVSCSYIH